MEEAFLDIAAPVLAGFTAETGLDRLPEAERQRILARISQDVFDAALVRALSEQGEGKNSELARRLSDLPAGADGKELSKILRESVPDFDRILTEEAAAFRLDAVATLKE